MEFLDNKHEFIHDVICKSVSNYNLCSNDFLRVLRCLSISNFNKPEREYYKLGILMKYLDLLYHFGIANEGDTITYSENTTHFFNIIDKYYICIELYGGDGTFNNEYVKIINDAYNVVHLYDDNLTLDDLMMVMYYAPIVISNMNVYNDSYFNDYKVYKANQCVDIFNVLKIGLERLNCYYKEMVANNNTEDSDVNNIRKAIKQYTDYNRIMQGEKLDLENPIKDNTITIPEFIPRLKEFLDYLASSGKVYSNSDLTFLQRGTNELYNYMIH